MSLTSSTRTPRLAASTVASHAGFSVGMMMRRTSAPGQQYVLHLTSFSYVLLTGTGPLPQGRGLSCGAHTEEFVTGRTKMSIETLNHIAATGAAE